MLTLNIPSHMTLQHFPAAEEIYIPEAEEEYISEDE